MDSEQAEKLKEVLSSFDSLGRELGKLGKLKEGIADSSWICIKVSPPYEFRYMSMADKEDRDTMHHLRNATSSICCLPDSRAQGEFVKQFRDLLETFVASEITKCKEKQAALAIH